MTTPRPRSIVRRAASAIVVLLWAIVSAVAAPSVGAQDDPGTPRWQRIGDIIHVIPATTKDVNGELVMHTSILDIPIDLETKERTIMQTIRDVKDAINRVSDTEFALGAIYIKDFCLEAVRIGASGETAREILLQAMTSVDFKTSWMMLYSPVLNRYSFIVYPVRKSSPANRLNWSICGLRTS